MLTRLFDDDPLTGTREIFHGDEDGNVTIETQQDITDIVELNKALMNDPVQWGEGARVAQLPMSIYFDLKRKGIIDEDDPKGTRLRRWLNDRDNQVFRTRPGKL